MDPSRDDYEEMTRDIAESICGLGNTWPLVVAFVAAYYAAMAVSTTGENTTVTIPSEWSDANNWVAISDQMTATGVPLDGWRRLRHEELLEVLMES